MFKSKEPRGETQKLEHPRRPLPGCFLPLHPTRTDPPPRTPQPTRYGAGRVRGGPRPLSPAYLASLLRVHTVTVYSVKQTPSKTPVWKENCILKAEGSPGCWEGGHPLTGWNIPCKKGVPCPGSRDRSGFCPHVFRRLGLGHPQSHICTLTCTDIRISTFDGAYTHPSPLAQGQWSPAEMISSSLQSLRQREGSVPRRPCADSQWPPLLPGQGGPSGLVTKTAVTPLCHLGVGDREALNVTSSFLNLAKLQIQSRVS